MSEGAAGVFGHVPTLICRDKREWVNPRKLFQKPLWLANAEALSLAANGRAITTLDAPRDQGRDGDAELWSLHAESTGRFSVLLYNQNTDKELSNSPVESSLIFGTAHLPNRLYESMWVPASSALKASCQDLSGNPNSIRLVGVGCQLIRQRTPQEVQRIIRKQWCHPYWLTFDDGAEVSVGANAEVTLNMTVPGDAYFEAWGLVMRSDGDFDISFAEGNQRSLMKPSEVLPRGLVGGYTGQLAGVNAASLPFMFPSSWVLHRSTTIRCTIKDTSAATNKVSVALVGRLLYQEVAPRGDA